jgi:photosystem II stability/assembly factor-like uncharacterized protein
MQNPGFCSSAAYRWRPVNAVPSLAASRSDEAIAPRPFLPTDDEENEARSMFDHNDWLMSRFSGRLDKEFFNRNLQQIQAQAVRHPELLPNRVAPAFVPKWRSIGPFAAQVAQNGAALKAVDSGRVRSILPHPTDPNTVYVLSAGGGLWKTANFNAAAPTWIALSDATVTTSGGAAALGRNPNTIYVGLGDPFDGIALVGGVMLHSVDGGATWALPINLPRATIIGDVKVDSIGPVDVVLVATDAGLFRSTDAGASYVRPTGIPSNVVVSSLVKSSAGWLAATFVADPCCRYGIGAHAMIYRSTDGGASFSPIANNVFAGAARSTMAVGAPGDATVYAIANQAKAGNSTGERQRDMFKSVDGGLTWAALGLNGLTPLNPNGDQPDLDVMHDQAWYNQMLLVDPTDTSRNTVHFGGNLSTVKTIDGGRTWTVQTNWLGEFGLPYTHADHHAAAVSTANGGKRLFFGNDGGLFVSDDGGRTWTDRKNIGLVDHLLYSLATSGADPSSVITGLQDNGTRIRANGTGVFNQTYGGDGFGVGWSQANGGAVLGSYVGNFVYYASTMPYDESMWTTPRFDGRCTYNGLEACYAYFYTTVYTPNAAADPTGKVFFARSYYDVFRTSDGGASWQTLSSTDAARTANMIRSAPHVIGVHPTNVQYIAAAGSGGAVRITTNGGRSWTTRRIPTTVSNGFNSNVAWVNATTLYVASENTSFQASGCWLAKTTDLGATWRTSCAGLPQVPISKVLVSPADPTGLTAYAATWIGVYKTTNGGATWEQFGAGLPVVQVSDLYMPARGGLLRISTYGRGVWEIPTAR